MVIFQSLPIKSGDFPIVYPLKMVIFPSFGVCLPGRVSPINRSAIDPTPTTSSSTCVAVPFSATTKPVARRASDAA